MSVKPNPRERITDFADRLGYPSVQIFMSLNPDGVKTTDSGVPYVDVNTLYPRYEEIGRQPASTEPESAGTINLEGVTAAPSVDMPDNSTQGGSENVTVDLLGDVNPDLKKVATAGINKPAPDVTLQTEMMFEDGVPKPDVPDGMQKITDTKTQTTSQVFDFAETERLLEERQKIDTQLSNIDLDRSQKEAQASLDAIKQIREQEEQFAIEREERQKLQRQREEELMGQVRAVTEEYKNMEVDPDRLFKKKGTGAKFLAAIAAGLGAYASAMTGTRNFALDIINSAIDDDIEAQKTEIAQAAGAITEQRNLLNDLIRKGMSDTEAEAAARAIMLQRAEQMLEQRLALIQKSDVKARGDLMRQQLQNETLLKMEQLKQAAAPKKTVVTTEEMKPTLAANLQQKFSEASAAAQGREAGKKIAAQSGPSEADKRERKVEGYVQLAPDKKSAQEARQAIRDINQLEEMIDELIDMKQKFGYDTGLSADRDAAKTKSILMVGKLKAKPFLDLGVLQQADVELLSKAIPMDPLGQIRTEPAIRQYQAVKDYVRKAKQIYFQALGMTPESGIQIDMSMDDLRNQFRSSQSTYGN